LPATAEPPIEAKDTCRFPWSEPPGNVRANAAAGLVRKRGLTGPRGLHFLGLGTFLAGDYLENDFLALVQRFEPIPKNCRMMYEYILTTILGDKAQAFLIVPPFHFSSGHIESPESLRNTAE